MPLINQYRKTAGIIERGTRVSQPAAADVLAGTFYYVTDEYVLERSTGAAWESISPNRDFVRVTNSANQSISNATWTVVTWDTETFDTNSMHSTVSNTSRLVAGITGKYLILCQIGFVSSGVGDRFLAIEKNAGGVEGAGTRLSAMQPGLPSATFDGLFCLPIMVSLTAGDYVEAFVYQSSGGALNIPHTGIWQLYFAMQHIGK